MRKFPESVARRPLKHLILCREYPPAPYPAGGIGTYARHIGRLLAEAGETVHIVAQRWDGAPEPVVRSVAGRLTVHRIPLDEPVWPGADGSAEREVLRGLAASTCPSQVFSWQAARYAERLIEEEGIDVIEAQEWEAPLYYLQLRRKLGLGPARQPPCIVHLHSPTQMIFTHNEWDKTLVDYLPLSQFEEFTIRAADSLICPSHYLANGVAALFGLDPESVTIVRYPMGETPVLARTPAAWNRDAICYVGRLELRKSGGVDRRGDPGGCDQHQRELRLLRQRYVPGRRQRGVGTRFPEAANPAFPALAVPLSWQSVARRTDAFARDVLDRGGSVALGKSSLHLYRGHATGLPVLASPTGGMVELIDDGVSGWVARDGSADALAEALTRALSVPPAERAAMGARATEAVRRLCANDVVVKRHLEHRSEVARAGLTLPPARQTAACGMGFVVTCSEAPERMAATLASVRLQTQPVPCVVVLDAALREPAEAEMPGVDRIVSMRNFSPSAAAARGFEALLALRPNLQAVAILDPTMRLAPSFAAACETALTYRPAVGVVIPWVLRDGRRSDLDVGPRPPAAPPLRQGNLPYGCAIRVEAVLSPESLSPEMQGWEAVTYPETLLFVEELRGAGKPARRRFSGMALIQNPSAGFAFAWFLAAPLREQARWIGRVLLHPGRIVRWIGWQMRQRVPEPSLAVQTATGDKVRGL